MPGLRRSPLLTGAVIVFAGATMALAASQISRYVRFGELRSVAGEISEDRPVSAAMLGRATARAADLVSERLCQSEFVKAAVVVSLVNLDRQDQDRDYDAWASALGLAEDVTRFSLTCRPTDGNFWLRLAMVRQTISEQPQEIARLVTLSQLYAPAEQTVITSRYSLYNRLTPETLALLAAPIGSDIGLICREMQNATRRRLAAPGENLANQIEATAPGCRIGVTPGGKTGRSRSATRRSVPLDYRDAYWRPQISSQSRGLSSDWILIQVSPVRFQGRTMLVRLSSTRSPWLVFTTSTA